ncbi:hypothetical protein GOV04_02060 [Candidatus Woesearchaeota archaeon]|nr:hypothetical protein [Candidatus Woesearchaeota archaeon]
MNKKANLHVYWVELSFALLLAIGLIFSVSAQNMLVSYILLILFAFMAGVLLAEQKSKKTPLRIIILGFLIGFMMGHYTHSIPFLIIFLVVSSLSYKAVDAGLILSKK